MANENARLFRSLPGIFHHFHLLPVCPAGKTNIRAVLKNRAKAKLFRIETQNPITPVGRPSIPALLKNRVFSFAARIYTRRMKIPGLWSKPSPFAKATEDRNRLWPYFPGVYLSSLPPSLKLWRTSRGTSGIFKCLQDIGRL